MAEAGITVDTLDPSEVVDDLLAITRTGGPNAVLIKADKLAAQYVASGPIKERFDQIEASQVTGDNKKEPVRILLTVATAAAALTAGSTHDGVVLAAGDSVGEAIAGGSPLAGIWQVQATGAALRRADADTGAELVRATFTVDAGTYVGTTWYVETADITVGTTPVVIKKVANAPAVTGEVVAARQGEASLAANLNKIKAAITPTVGSSRLWSARVFDRSGKFVLRTKKAVTAQAFDFQVAPPVESAGRAGKSRLFRRRVFDKSGRFQLAGRLLSAELLRFDQVSRAEVVSDNGGPITPTPSADPDWLVPQNFPFSVELANLIPNTVSSWWVNKYWRCGSSQFIGLVMRRTPRRRDGANYYRSGDIVVVEIRDDSPNALVYRIGQQYPLTDCHNADAPTVRPGLKPELGLVVFQSDHASSSDGTYTWMSKNKSPAGLGYPWKTEPAKQGTTYNQAWIRHDRPWERWNLYRGGPSNRWYLMIWDDRQRKVTFRKPLFNDSEDQSYFNFWPKPDATGIRMSWYSNPGSVSVDYRNLMMLDLNHDGWMVNLYGNAVGENIFSTGFSEIDALTPNSSNPTQGPTKVYTPANTDQVFRQCRLINTRPNDWQVPIVEFDRVIGEGWPQESECRIRLLNINTAGSAPVTTVKDVCWGGASIHNSNKGYVAGVDLIGHDKVVATRWMPSAPAGQKGQLDIYDVSGSAGFNNWPSLFSVRAEEKIIRPCTSLEIMGDELAVSYRLGPDLMWHQGKPFDPADADTASGGYETFAKWAMNTVIKNVETLQS